MCARVCVFVDAFQGQIEGCHYNEPVPTVDEDLLDALFEKWRAMP